MKINFEWKKNKYEEDELYIGKIIFAVISKTTLRDKISFLARFLDDCIQDKLILNQKKEQNISWRNVQKNL